MYSVKAYDIGKEGSSLISNNFKVKEFASKDGFNVAFISDELVNIVQNIRDHFGKPLVINSGFRSQAHNKKVKGAKNSMHLYGTAADIHINGVQPIEIAKYAETLFKKLGINGGIGLYQSFVHVDVRKVKYRWDSRAGKEVKVSGF